MLSSVSVRRGLAASSRSRLAYAALRAFPAGFVKRALRYCAMFAGSSALGAFLSEKIRLERVSPQCGGVHGFWMGGGERGLTFGFIAYWRVSDSRLAARGVILLVCRRGGLPDAG